LTGKVKIDKPVGESNDCGVMSEVDWQVKWR